MIFPKRDEKYENNEWSPQLFISITDFGEKYHFSHILITLIDSMGKETKSFDNTNYDVEKWIQVGYLKILKDWSILSNYHFPF